MEDYIIMKYYLKILKYWRRQFKKKIWKSKMFVKNFAQKIDADDARGKLNIFWTGI